MAGLSDIPVPPSPSDLRVLLVEAEHDTRGRYAAGLRDAGFIVVETETGQQALEAAARSTPHLIVADLDMPSIDGLTFCRRLRGEAGAEAVLLITLASRRPGAGEAEPDDEMEVQLVKPCAPARLLAEVRHLVGVAAERRHHAARRRGGDAALRPVDAELLARIRDEYADLPSLKLTLEQAHRLWQGHPPEIEAALDTLVQDGYLQRNAAGRYERAGGSAGRTLRPRMARAELEPPRRAGHARRPDGTDP